MARPRVERGYLGTLLRLTLLAPGIVQSILDEHLPIGLTRPRPMEPFSPAWAEQRMLFDAATGPGCRGTHLHPDRPYGSA
jgi:hypothetical protein